MNRLLMITMTYEKRHFIDKHKEMDTEMQHDQSLPLNRNQPVLYTVLHIES